MRAIAAGLTVLFVLGVTAVSAHADVIGQPATVRSSASPGGDIARPPVRPLPITAEQAAALESISHQPDQAVPPDTCAAYSPKAEKIATEASAVGFYAGYFGTLAAILISAAPL